MSARLRRVWLLAAIAACVSAAASRRTPRSLDTPPQSWRAAATEEDRQRLHDWRSVWVAALANGGASASDPALLDPDGGQGGEVPPGDYRCRRLVIGGGTIATGAWGTCAVVARGAFADFTGPAGASSIVGRIYPDTPRRAVFLGSVRFADEHAAPRHGQMAGRDLAGVAQRIGEARWRIALPRAPFGGTMQIVELTR